MEALKKIKRKTFYLCLRKLPHNLHYKPHNYFPHINHYINEKGINGAFYKIIYPSYISMLAIEPGLYRQITPDSKPPLQIRKPESCVLKIKHGRLYANPYQTHIAVIDDEKDGAVGDLSFQYINHHVVNDVGANDIFKTNFFYSPRHISGSAFAMASGGGGVANYFHWMFDSLSKLYLLEKSGFRADKIIVPSYKTPFQKETLAALGIDDNRVMDFSKNRHLSVDTLIVASSAGDVAENKTHENIHYSKWAIDFLRSKFSHLTADRKPKEKAIFISRQHASKRKIINEQELYPVLKKHRIAIKDTGKMSFPEQVALFNSARLVVAPHGAALTNLVFCQPGAHLIEIFSRRYVKGLYVSIASLCGLNYDFFVGDSTSKHQKPNYSDIRVDVKKFEEKLEEALRSVRRD